MQRAVVFFGGAVASILFAHGHATDSGFVVALMVLTAGAAIWPRAIAAWLVVLAIIVAAGFAISALFAFDLRFDLESPPAPTPADYGWWSVLACVVLAVAGAVGRLLVPRNLDVASIPSAQARR